MNSHARETQLQYDFRKCNEAIAQTKYERTVLQALLRQAVVDSAINAIVAVKQKLKEHRTRLNQLCARRWNLRKKLNHSKTANGGLMQNDR